VKILLVSQMYPGPTDPDLGVFVRGLEQALAARGHVVERAVLDRRRSGKRKYLTLSAATLQASRRAATVIAVSDYLRRELETKVPEARGKTEVVDSGVDLERFTVAPAPAGDVRFLCIASLIGRKNVLRLADAFARVGRGTLTFVGDGPLRAELEGRSGVELVGRIAYDRVPEQIAAAHVVCQPSLIEPFGQAVLEAMACGRTVVATRIGGPPEFVPPDAGVLVDPADEDALLGALEAAASFPCPNPAARAAAEAHDVRAQAAKVEAILERAARGPRA
jgi:glycosyltransferase involved in cell wall biosynthesis